MASTIATAIKTIVCTVGLRARGVRCGIVSCEGRLPRLHLGGTLVLQRLALRGTVVAVELGAERGATLSIGPRTFINQGATIVATTNIDIGADVRIGDFVAVYDSDHHPVEEGALVTQAPVRIGDNAWLGRNVIVLPGVTIGEHAVVAAGSIVRNDVAPATLVAGNPARLIRELTASSGWRRP